MSGQGDFVTNFQDDILATSLLLKKCSSLEDSIRKDVHGIGKLPMAQLGSTLDRMAITLNKSHMQGMDAQIKAKATAISSKEADRACKERNEAAEDKNWDWDELMRIYSSSIITKASGVGSDTAPQFHEFAKLAKKLLEYRHIEVDSIPISLVKTLYDDYLKEQANIDEDFMINQAVVKPICLLSSKPLENPVRAPCGHYFSGEIIKSAIDGKSIECPSTGCSQTIKASNLIRDHFKDLEVKQWLKETERQRLEDTQQMTQV